MRSLVPQGSRGAPSARRRSRSALVPLTALLVAAVLMPPAATAAPPYPLVPCFTGLDAGGNGQFPPTGRRGFTSHDGVMLIQNGLPASAAIIGRLSFFDLAIGTETPGGPLGGEVTDVSGRVMLEMRGTGSFSGYSRTITLPVTMRFNTGPQVPGASIQSFAVDLDQAFAQLLGDGEFDLLRITAGSGFGMPSPGRATLTRHWTGDYWTDAIVDMTYRVDFVGSPFAMFAGMSGSTVGEHRQRAGSTTNAECLEPDNGLGTAPWTPFCTGWDAKTEGILYEGEPGTFLIGRFNRTPPGGPTLVAGGPFGGEQSSDTELLTLEVVGEGNLAGFSRAVSMPLLAVHDLGPPMVLQPLEGRVSDQAQGFGQLLGDPDFDLLRFVSGSTFGYVSPGHTSFTHAPWGNWSIDGYFDQSYRVDMVGAPGGGLAGRSGSAASESRLQAGRERIGYCPTPDNGSGTGIFPLFSGTGYTSPRHVRGVFDGMPPGSPLLADIAIVPQFLLGSGPGGPLGGEWQLWSAKLVIHLTGVGAWAGYTRTLSVAANVLTATAPIVPGSSPQHFETDLTQVQAQIPPGDPDFDLLRITGGTGFGLPSPGYTNLLSAGPGLWRGDSFFDVTYRIDFIGAIGGLFAGRSGSSNDRQRFVSGDEPTLSTPPPSPPSALAVGPAAPNPTRAGASVSLELPRRARVRVAVLDVAGRLVRMVEDGTREAGRHALAWDGAGAGGARLSPGVYLLRVDADGQRFTRRVVLVQ